MVEQVPSVPLSGRTLRLSPGLLSSFPSLALSLTTSALDSTLKVFGESFASYRSDSRDSAVLVPRWPAQTTLGRQRDPTLAAGDVPLAADDGSGRV